jgi:hypothetical protein
LAFKTFNVGDVLTASDVNTYLMKQTNIVCTSGTRPGSPVEGEVIYETDTDRFMVWDGAAWTVFGDIAGWTAFTPTWTCTGTAPSLGNGSLAGSYKQLGKTVHMWGQLTAGSTTTFGTGTWIMSIPITATSNGAQMIGSCYPQDTGVNAYAGVVGQNSTTTRTFISTGAAGVAAANITNVFPFTWANGDLLRWSLTYESI